MRWYVSIAAVLVAALIVGGDVAGVAAPNPVNQAGNLAAEKENAPSIKMIATPGMVFLIVPPPDADRATQFQQ